MAKRKILIIDDEKLVRTVLTDLLQMKGYTVVAAEDGPTGLAAAMKEKPNAIILDVTMPGMDGFEVCEALKKDVATTGIPVIIVTASDDAHLTKKAFKAGADFTLVKAGKPEGLLSTLHLALSLARPS
ncbi:MAG: response regulator [candidate division NC10 bacterium]|nr:response regulator [candidate division NC10 bacterium]